MRYISFLRYITFCAILIEQRNDFVAIDLPPLPPPPPPSMSPFIIRVPPMHLFRLMSYSALLILAQLPIALFAAVFAQTNNAPVIGKPIAGGIGFQPAVTELARDVHWLDHMILIIITGIVVLVLALLAIIVVRYNHHSNTKPASFTHYPSLEIAWTIVPVLILIVIGLFSIPILFKQQTIPKGDVVIKATGYQWFWTYSYPDHAIEFDSNLLERADLAKNGYNSDEYLLATDNPVVVPVNKNIVMQITGGDVIHSWTIPAFGVKQDGVPGRLAELWFKPDTLGVFFGQCSELCGKDHAYMPITVKVVSEQDYANWLDYASKEFAAHPIPVPVPAHTLPANTATAARINPQ